MPSADAAKVPFAGRQPSRRLAEPLGVRRVAFAAVLACVRGLPIDAAGYPIIPLTRVSKLAVAIRAFESADERARIARGRPLPGSLRPERKQSRKPRARVDHSAAPSTSTVVEQPPPAK